MSDKLTEIATEITEFVSNGDYMSALSYFEAEAREVINSTDQHENAALLEIMRKQISLIDEEEWQEVLYNTERMKEILNG